LALKLINRLLKNIKTGDTVVLPLDPEDVQLIFP